MSLDQDSYPEKRHAWSSFRLPDVGEPNSVTRGSWVSTLPTSESTSKCRMTLGGLRLLQDMLQALEISLAGHAAVGHPQVGDEGGLGTRAVSDLWRFWTGTPYAVDDPFSLQT